MKLVIFAGPPTCGKTTVIRQVIKRMIMKNGAMQKIVISNAEERNVAAELKKMDDIMLHFRGLIRAGEEINNEQLEIITK